MGQLKQQTNFFSAWGQLFWLTQMKLTLQAKDLSKPLASSSSDWRTILKQWKNIPFNGNHYHFPNNYFNCCITRTVPAGCSLSLFSIIPLFSLGGTRGEWPKDNVKQNVLLCKWKRTFQSTKHESKKWQQKMLLSH